MKVRHGNAMITEADAREILSMRGLATAQSVGDRYNIGAEAVRRIWRRESWRHISNLAMSGLSEPEQERLAQESAKRAFAYQQSLGENFVPDPHALDGILQPARPVQQLPPTNPEAQARADEQLKRWGIKK